MSEPATPPQGPQPQLVPHASKEKLADEVGRLSEPLLETTLEGHAMVKLHETMKRDHTPIMQWGADVAANLNLGFGGNPGNETNEKRAFENAFLIAYGLVRAGYEEAGKEIPGAMQPPEWYMWIRDEPEQSIAELFEALNERVHKLDADYPELIDAIRSWAVHRIPGYGSGYTMGVVDIAAAEMFYAFQKTEETIILEKAFEQE